MEAPLIEAHRHGIALARPFLRALLFALAGAACFFAPWTPFAAAGAMIAVLWLFCGAVLLLGTRRP